MVLPEPGAPTRSRRLFEDSKAATMSSAILSARVSYPSQPRGNVEVQLPKGSLDQVAACTVGAGLHLLAQLGFELADTLFDRFRTLLLGACLHSRKQEGDDDP